MKTIYLKLTVDEFDPQFHHPFIEMLDTDGELCDDDVRYEIITLPTDERLAFALGTLIEHNYWRRADDEDVEMRDPKEIGEAIDIAIDLLSKLKGGDK